MDNETLLRRMEAFDPELSDLLLSALDRQCSTLSLIPTANAVSPFSAYLKGSVLGNDFMDHHAIERRSRLEKMACQRVLSLAWRCSGPEMAIFGTWKKRSSGS